MEEEIDLDTAPAYNAEPPPPSAGPPPPPADGGADADGAAPDRPAAAPEPAAPPKSAAQIRLEAIQKRLADERAKNHKEVVQEDRRKRMTPEELRRAEQRGTGQAPDRAAASASESDKLRAVTAEEAEAERDKAKKKDKRRNMYAWDVFNDQALHRTHKRREGNLATFGAVEGAAADAVGPFDPLSYGDEAEGYRPREDRVDALVDELNLQKRKRETSSRRRAHHDEDDVSAINERNRAFNAKAARAFDKYAAEIKSNLERGTAL